MEPLRGLYVHIPFCSVKCFYCDFTAFAGQRSSVRRYLSAVEREAQRRFGPAVQTLYIGGGTPSELSASDIAALFGLLRGPFEPSDGFKEITFEANPESLPADKLDALVRAGVTRISLGLQTLEPRLLKAVGRRHTVEDFLAVYRDIRKRGIAVNVDLMYALPGQTFNEAGNSLEAVLALAPDHISLYGLQVEDRTLFGKREVEIDEDLAREMFERSLDRLAAAGYHHYEISNFARSGYESIHNRIYWRNGEYVGLGCGASGFLNGVRYVNKDRLVEYCAALERGEDPAAERESLAGQEKLGETIWLGLRLLDGLTLTSEMRDVFAEEFRRVQEQGWLRIESGVARLTRQGVFLANRVFEEFVPPFRPAAGGGHPVELPNL